MSVQPGTTELGRGYSLEGRHELSTVIQQRLHDVQELVQRFLNCPSTTPSTSHNMQFKRPATIPTKKPTTSRPKTYFFKNLDNTLDLELYLRSNEGLLSQTVQPFMRSHAPVKFCVYIKYAKIEDRLDNRIVVLRSPTELVSEVYGLNRKLESMNLALLRKNEEFCSEGSGWRLEKILGLHVIVNPASYHGRGSTSVSLPLRVCPQNVMLAKSSSKCTRHKTRQPGQARTSSRLEHAESKKLARWPRHVQMSDRIEHMDRNQPQYRSRRMRMPAI